MYTYPSTLPKPVQHYSDEMHSIFNQHPYTVLCEGIATPDEDPNVYLIPLRITLAPPQVAMQHMEAYLACQFDDVDTETALPSKIAYYAVQYSDKYPAAPVAAIAIDSTDTHPHDIAALIIEHAQQVCE